MAGPGIDIPAGRGTLPEICVAWRGWATRRAEPDVIGCKGNPATDKHRSIQQSVGQNPLPASLDPLLCGCMGGQKRGHAYVSSEYIQAAERIQALFVKQARYLLEEPCRPAFIDGVLIRGPEFESIGHRVLEVRGIARQMRANILRDELL